MTILTLNRKELEKKTGKITLEIEEKITNMGTPVEEINEKEISVEVFPNRPDLLSLQNFSRALLQYLGKESIKEFKVHEPEKDYLVEVEKSVKKVRPHTACAIVKNLKLDDEKIKELIDIQEKLHLSIGRKRKKVAIGIYPLEKITLPITFKALKPDEIKFLPLESPNGKEMTGRQILKQHPTGKEYAHLLENEEVYPIFIDAKGKILSMPPIINSHETGKISEKTTDVFIECSGSNLEYLKKTLNIILSAIDSMGGKIYAMEIKNSKDFISPDMKPEKLEFKIENINKTLGLDLKEKDIKSLLEKMGIGLEKEKEKYYALIPCYRTDILHWIDLTEEIAIAYGYENFKEDIPKISTTAEEDKKARIKRTISEILAGFGLLETSSFYLTTKDNIKNIYYDFTDFIEVEESKTEYNVLRSNLLSNSMKILTENLSSTYPQKIFETGKIFEKDKLAIDSKERAETGIIEKEKLCISLTGENINFNDAKQTLDYLFKMLNIEYELKEAEDVAFIPGRTGKILVNKKEVGLIGEISPRVLKNCKLKMPVASLELDLSFLF